MTRIENHLSIIDKKGYEKILPHFELCPYLIDAMQEVLRGQDYRDFFGMATREVRGTELSLDQKDYYKYFKETGPDMSIDLWGVGHQKGSSAAFHMTKIISPLVGNDDETIRSYPFPDFAKGDESHMRGEVEELHAKDLVAVGRMGQTIWERAWMVRGMEDLMTDMMMEDYNAEFVLDRITEGSVQRAEAFAKAGVDILWVGDDVGMQNSLMMSEEMYRSWLKPRLKKVIDAAKAIKSDLRIMYHSCGYIKPLIEDLIDVGVNILNPVQPECMDFQEIHSAYSDRLCFHGTIGTQSTMPLGNPQQVKNEVKRNLDIAGKRGGLICCPTHLLEPDVPIENIMAYAEAIEEYNR